MLSCNDELIGDHRSMIVFIRKKNRCGTCKSGVACQHMNFVDAITRER